jgi:hypothetical protein
MNNVTEIVALLRQQAELEFRILAGRADAGATELEWKSTRRRASDANVTAFGGSH